MSENPTDVVTEETPKLNVEPGKLVTMIDHTLLKPQATEADIKRLCEEARFYAFGAVCVNPIYVKLCVRELAGSNVKVCTVAGFPLGANVEAIKVSEAQTAINHGAKEVDMVINIGLLKAGEFDLVKREISSVAHHCHTGRSICKVIIEAALLEEAEKIKACELAKEAGADFVKTSTGFVPGGGARAVDVRLMRNVVGPKMGVKASGGIRNLDDVLKLIAAGATRLGTSSSVKIMQELLHPSEPSEE
ncbi:MAG: deoxyribose-phosphate aldolase [Chloroflexi bacterium]|uniref:Deoxyribose-phosphate aldolase n=2 Tax=Candidatus Chlorohelix allophototropha TaxID=3003348 RepID=A0A8T7M1I5_9CHLR|nr:deoxyribose-phosphate aldolase [Chloroflexota bacterium]